MFLVFSDWTSKSGPRLHPEERLNGVWWVSDPSVVIPYAGYTHKYFYNLIRSSKRERPYTRGQNNFAPIVCRVPRCDKDSRPHTNRFSTKSWNGKPCKISGENKQDFFYCNFRTKNIQGQKHINYIKYNNEQKNNKRKIKAIRKLHFCKQIQIITNYSKNNFKALK